MKMSSSKRRTNPRPKDTSPRKQRPTKFKGHFEYKSTGTTTLTILLLLLLLLHVVVLGFLLLLRLELVVQKLSKWGCKTIFLQVSAADSLKRGRVDEALAEQRGGSLCCCAWRHPFAFQPSLEFSCVRKLLLLLLLHVVVLRPELRKAVVFFN